MEFIKGETLDKSKINGNGAENVRSQIERALQLLHGNNFVFGDLRPPNVMITTTKAVKLIDFNWAGEQGQAKYPCLILMSGGISWPKGVKPLALIEIDHDLQMLEKMFPKPAPSNVD